MKERIFEAWKMAGRQAGRQLDRQEGMNKVGRGEDSHDRGCGMGLGSF